MPTIRIQARLDIAPDIERLLANFEQIAPKAIERGMENIGKLGRKSLQEAVRQKGLVSSGRLEKSVDYEVRSTATYTKTVIGSSLFYARILDGGAAPHTIKPKNRKAITPGADHPVRVASHPGVHAYQFTDETLKKLDGSSEIQSAFSVGLEEIVQRLGGGIG